MIRGPLQDFNPLQSSYGHKCIKNSIRIYKINDRFFFWMSISFYGGFRENEFTEVNFTRSKWFGRFNLFIFLKKLRFGPFRTLLNNCD